MGILRDNAVWFRHRVATRRHRRLWLSSLAHPAFVLAPGLLLEGWMCGYWHDYCFFSPHDWLALYLTCFLQVFYFAVRGLTATVGSVSRGRERRTFESLQGTCVRPAELLLGHFAAALAPRLPDLLWSPCILLLYPSLGPVEWLKLMAVTVAVLIGFAACGMAVSTAARSTLAAGQIGFSVLTGAFFGTVWFDTLVQQATGSNGRPWLSFLFNPLASVVGLVALPGLGWSWVWILLICVYMGLAAWLLRFALIRLGRPARVSAGGPRQRLPLRLAWLKQQNKHLAKQYGIQGFPTEIVLNSNGKKLGQHVGYMAGGPQAFLAWIGGLKK